MRNYRSYLTSDEQLVHGVLFAAECRGGSCDTFRISFLRYAQDIGVQAHG